MRRLHKIFIILFAVTSFTSVVDSAPSIDKAYFTPFIIRDNIDYTKLVLYCGEESIQELKIVLPFLVSEQNPVVLRDDGKNGDDLANDNYFTKDSLFFNVGINSFTNVSYNSAEITFIYKDGTNEKSNLNIGLTLIFVNQDLFPIPDIKRSFVGSNIDNTDYVIAIKTSNTLGYELTKTFYRYFEDNKDFLAITCPYSNLGNINAFFSAVSNNISGIGLGYFDNTQFWGSNDRLQGIVTFYNAAGLGTFNHELLHRWAVYLGAQFNLGYGSHWSALVANTSGFGFGSLISGGVYKKLEHLAGNDYRAITLDYTQEMKYNDIELYLMGLKDQSAIKSPLESLINPVSLGNYRENGILYELFSASGISVTKIEDIIKVHGNRNPSSLSAQRNFNLALIVSCYRSLTDVEFAFYDYLMKEYEKAESDAGLTFYAATGGLAEINSRIISIGERPQLVRPVNDAEIPLNEINYSWHKINNSVNYRFQLSDDHDFSHKVVDSLKSDTSLVLYMSSVPGQYFWRVKAINNYGESYWSEIRSFTIFNASLSVSPVSMDVGLEAGSTTFIISSNTTWSISVDADWLTVSSSSGRGNGTITATYSANASIISRVGTITISGTGASPQAVTVSQKGIITLSVAPSNRDVGLEAGSTTFTISSNTIWTVTDDVDWLTVNPASGKGNETITATFIANPLAINSIGTITISSSGISPQSVTVSQSGQTDIREPDDIGLTVYPNPAKDFIVIKSDVAMGADISVSVVDALGKSYYLFKGDNSEKEKTVDLTSLKSGLYFVIIRSTNTIKTYKIIKD